MTRERFQLPRSSSTFLMITWSLSAPPKVQTRTGIPPASHRHPEHDLGKVRPVILGGRVVHPGATLMEGCVGETLVVVVGAVFEIFFQSIAFPVGRGGVEEQQVELKIEQVRHREDDPLDELCIDTSVGRHLQDPSCDPQALPYLAGQPRRPHRAAVEDCYLP